VCSDKYVHV